MRILGLGLVLLLSACASMTQPHDQRIQFTAVNGDNPKCTISNPLYKKNVYPPQSIHFERTRYPLVVECTADGGKYRRLLIEPERNPSSSYFWPPGHAVDRVTGVAWQYPPYIEIDFDWMPFDMRPGQTEEPPARAQGRSMIHPDEYFGNRGLNK